MWNLDVNYEGDLWAFRHIFRMIHSFAMCLHNGIIYFMWKIWIETQCRCISFDEFPYHTETQSIYSRLPFTSIRNNVICDVFRTCAHWDNKSTVLNLVHSFEYLWKQLKEAPNWNAEHWQVNAVHYQTGIHSADKN